LSFLNYTSGRIPSKAIQVNKIFALIRFTRGISQVKKKLLSKALYVIQCEICLYIETDVIDLVRLIFGLDCIAFSTENSI